jgi:hypothetical protein
MHSSQFCQHSVDLQHRISLLTNLNVKTKVNCSILKHLRVSHSLFLECLLGYCAVYSGSSLPPFRKNFSHQTARVHIAAKQLIFSRVLFDRESVNHFQIYTRITNIWWIWTLVRVLPFSAGDWWPLLVIMGPQYVSKVCILKGDVMFLIDDTKLWTYLADTKRTRQYK